MRQYTKKWYQDGWVKLFPGWREQVQILTQLRTFEIKQKTCCNIKSGAKKMVHKVWNNITQEHLQSLYKSMPQPVQAAVDAQDSDAKY